MATQMSELAEDHILNYLKGTAMPTAPTTLEIALFSAVFTSSAALPTELSYTGYARQTITMGTITSNTTVGAGDSIANSATVTFPSTPSTGGPWSIAAYAVFANTGTSGAQEQWFFENLSSAISVGNSASVVFNAGSITVTEL